MTDMAVLDAENATPVAVIAGDRPPRGGRSVRARGPRTHRLRPYQLWFALPAIVLVVVFFLLPFLANVGFAFVQWTNYSTVITFNGLKNFLLLINLGVLWHAILLTVVYAVVSMVVQNIVSVSLAKALQETGRLNTVYRSVYFIPVLISPLAAGYIWAAVLTPTGPLNAAVSLVVPGGFHFDWLGNDVTALVAVAAIDAWKWSGLVTLIYIAGLNRIPAAIVDAAKVDGAGAWRRFRSIEFPLLAPAFTFNVVVTLVGAFSAFDVIIATTAGGPGDATQVLNVAVFEQYGQGLFGTASALGLVIAALVVLTAVPLIGFLRSREVRM